MGGSNTGMGNVSDVDLDRRNVCPRSLALEERPNTSKITMTIKHMIYELLRWKPGSDGMTATQMFHMLRNNGQDVKLSSLSSQLNKMVHAGELQILSKFGPRKGNGYVLAAEDL